MLAVRKTTAKRAIGDEADAKLAHRIEQLSFRVAAPERILRLQRGDRMNFLRASDRVGCGFGQA